MIHSRLYQFFVVDDSARWRTFAWAWPTCIVIGVLADTVGIPRSVSVPFVALLAVGLLLLSAFLGTSAVRPNRFDRADNQLSRISRELQVFLATDAEFKTPGSTLRFALRLLGLTLNFLIRSASLNFLSHRQDLTNKKA